MCMVFFVAHNKWYTLNPNRKEWKKLVYIATKKTTITKNWYSYKLVKITEKIDKINIFCAKLLKSGEKSGI